MRLFGLPDIWENLIFVMACRLSFNRGQKKYEGRIILGMSLETTGALELENCFK